MIDNDLISACDIFLKCIDSVNLSPEELAGAINHFNISAKQIMEASVKLPKHYNLTVKGIRRIIELYLGEFIELFKDADKVQIYTTHPTPPYVMMLAANAGEGTIKIKTPEFVVMLVLRSFFGWKREVKGESESVCPHCGMNQMRLFLIESGCIAPPEVLWNWGLLCDVNNKTGGVLQKNYPDIIGMDITQLKGHFTGQERFQYLSMQIKQKFHMEISESAERKAWDQWISLILTMESITELNNKTQGQLLGGNDLALFQSILLTAFSDWIPVIEAVKLLFIELKDRKKQMEYSEKNCLYCYYVPLTIPEVSTIFAGYGINLIGNTAFLSYKAERYPQQSLSDKIASMCMQILISNDHAAEAQEVCKRLKEYRCRGYLTGMFSNDRWIGGNQKDIARLIEKESGYPVFFLDMDFWDNNNLEILEDRIKIIAERIKLSQCHDC